MSDRWAITLAVAVFAGALAAVDGHAPPVPLGLAAPFLAASWLAARPGHLRPELLCLGAALLAAGLAQRSVAGLDAPLATGPVHAEVVLVGDPTPDGRGGVTVDVRHDGRRLRGVARAGATGALDERLAGERVSVVGAVEPLGPKEMWLRHRHIAGRLRIDTVSGWRVGDPVTRLANGLRRTLERGAEGLPDRQRSLLAGITLGDERAQPADMTDAFRAAGLTHLLAVSGQNVAFVLVVATPLLTRLRFGPRLAATLAILALFALVTRAEPSVLRATAMASVAATGAALGRPSSTVRTLALGVAAMVLVDPLLATSVGFQLSVAGTVGLVAGASRVEQLLPGPRWLTAPLSVTLAAQVAVAPLLVATFGSVPVASVPANLLAAPAAGPLMVWGLTGGLVAGVAGGAVAQVVHAPTRVLLTWLEAVALGAARWPLGDLRAGHLVGLGTGALVLVVGHALVGRATGASRRRGRLGSGLSLDRDEPARRRQVGRRVRGLRRTLAGDRPAGPARAIGETLRTAGVVVLVVVAAVTVAPLGDGGSVPAEVELGTGAALWRGGGGAVVVIDGRARDDIVLARLRRAQVERVDLVVVRRSSQAAADAVDALRHRWPGVTVMVPAPHRSPASDEAVRVEGGVSPPTGTVVVLGDVHLTVDRNSAGRLDVDIVVVVGVPGAPVDDPPAGPAGHPAHGSPGAPGNARPHRRTTPRHTGARLAGRNGELPPGAPTNDRGDPTVATYPRPP